MPPAKGSKGALGAIIGGVFVLAVVLGYAALRPVRSTSTHAAAPAADVVKVVIGGRDVSLGLDPPDAVAAAVLVP